MVISISFFIFLIKICFSFVLGVISYKNKILKKYLGLIFNLGLLKLIIILLILYISVTYIIPYLYDLFISSITIEAASNTPSTSENNSSKSNSGGDAIIMTAALASGAKLAQKAPNLATKAAIVAGSVGVGATAIIVKNISGNISSDIGKSSLILLTISNINIRVLY